MTAVGPVGTTGAGMALAVPGESGRSGVAAGGAWVAAGGVVWLLVWDVVWD